MALLFPAGYNFDTAAGRLFIFENETTTPATVYTDELLTTAHDHPIILDSSGRCGNIYATDGASYTVQLTDSSAAEVWSRNDIWGVLKTPDTTVIADTTYQIPTDYASLQSALDSILTVQGITITLNIESGHQLDSGVVLSQGDWSHFIITSTDAEVTLSASFPSVSDFMNLTYANGPTLSCLINANGQGRHGVFATKGSSVYVDAGCGVKNTNNRGIYLNNSRAAAGDSIWTGCGQNGDGVDRTLWATRAAHGNFQGATFDNGGSTDAAVYLSRNSQIFAYEASIDNSAGHAIWCHRGSIFSGHDITVVTCADKVVFANRGATVDVTDITATGVGGDGVGCIGSTVFLGAASITAAGSSTSDGITCSNAGRVSGDGITIANFQNGVVAQGAANVAVPNCTITGSSNNGVEARDASHVTVVSGSVTGSTTNDLFIDGGSFIAARGCTTENGSGTPAVGDCSVSSFNAIDGDNGVIWD